MVYSKLLSGKSRIVKLVREMKKKIGSFTWAVLYASQFTKNKGYAGNHQPETSTTKYW